jgi:hypothetical protein
MHKAFLKVLRCVGEPMLNLAAYMKQCIAKQGKGEFGFIMVGGIEL